MWAKTRSPPIVVTTTTLSYYYHWCGHGYDFSRVRMNFVNSHYINVVKEYFPSIEANISNFLKRCSLFNFKFRKR